MQFSKGRIRCRGKRSQGMVLDVREVDGEARVDLESPVQLQARV